MNEQQRKGDKIIRVYVAGPYSADNVLDVLKNIGHGQKVCGELFQLGFAPFCPWHDKSYVIDFYTEDFTVKQFYDYSIAWLRVSDCMLLIGDWENSKGTLTEKKIAEGMDIPIFGSIKNLVEYYDE